MPCLTDEQLAHFDEEGYLLVRGMLDVEEVIQPIIDEYHGVLDNLARELYQACQIASTYDDLPFGKRLTQIVVESGQIHAQYFDFSLPQTGIEARYSLLGRASRFSLHYRSQPPRRGRVHRRP